MRSRTSGLLVFAVAVALSSLLPPRAARADQPADWKVTFDPSASGSYLPAAADLQIIVVAAGTSAPELRAAADAFTAALRASGRAGTVLDDASVGELGTVDDATALAKVRALPVTHVAIVRLLVGHPPKALVTVYAKGKSEPIASFIATAGVALAPGAVESSDVAPGSGVSSAAIAKVDDLNEESQAELEKARQRYKRELVGYDGIDVTVRGNGSWVSATIETRFYLGEMKQPLEGAAFYKAVGRDDLAASYESRSTRRTLFMVSGVVLGLASIYPLTQFDASACDLGTPGYRACEDEQQSRNQDMLIATTVLMGAGTLAYMIGYYTDEHPVSDDTRRQLASEHNAELKSGLHLDEARARRGKSYAWHVTPVVSSSYGGMNLALTF